MNKCRSIFWSFAAILLLGGSIAATVTTANEDRHIRVTINVRDSAGQGISGIVVSLALTPDVTMRPVVDALTDDAGRATLEAIVPTSQDEVEIRHAFVQPNLSDNEGQRTAIQRLKALRTKCVLPLTHAITLDPKTTEYELIITASPGVEVTAHVVDEHGRPHDCWIWGPQHSVVGFVGKGKSKPLRPVRQGAPSLIFVASSLSSSGTIVRPIQLTAEQTSKNVDLGDVRIDSLEGQIQFQLCLAYPTAFAKGTLPPMGGATFVAADASSDGPLIVSYRGAPYPPGSNAVCLGDPSQELYPSLPPGKYYVAPEWFHYSDDQVNLITAVLKKKNLSDSVIPMVEISKDAANRFELNIAEMRDAISKFVEKTTDEAKE